MRKILFSTLATLALGLAFTSCSNDTEDAKFDASARATYNIALTEFGEVITEATIAPNSPWGLSIYYAIETDVPNIDDITITPSAAWVTTAVEFVTIYDDEGEIEGVYPWLAIHSQDNTTTDARVATITLSAADANTFVFTLTQEGISGFEGAYLGTATIDQFGNGITFLSNVTKNSFLGNYTVTNWADSGYDISLFPAYDEEGNEIEGAFNVSDYWYAGPFQYVHNGTAYEIGANVRTIRLNTINEEVEYLADLEEPIYLQFVGANGIYTMNPFADGDYFYGVEISAIGEYIEYGEEGEILVEFDYDVVISRSYLGFLIQQ